MNKQQLASKIWESANKMRSKIEANEYKDYILGFIFYKFLSENELMRFRRSPATSIRRVRECSTVFSTPCRPDFPSLALMREASPRPRET